MYIPPFKFQEFNITGDDIPENVATKILVYHLLPAIDVRKQLGVPIFPSQKSCWRPYKWEISKDRDGTSEHCFGQDENGNFNPLSKGACDWTCNNFDKNGKKLLEALIQNTSYTRIAFYKSHNFYHCDYKNKNSRWVYNEQWVKQYKI